MIFSDDVFSFASHDSVDFNWTSNCNIVKNHSIILISRDDFELLRSRAYEVHTHEIFILSLAHNEGMNVITTLSSKTIIDR